MTISGVMKMARRRVYVEENPRKLSFDLALYLSICLFIGIIFAGIYIIPTFIIDGVIPPIDWGFVLIFMAIISFGFLLVKVIKKIEEIEKKW